MDKLVIDRIYCGDSIKILESANCLKPNLVFADPPFNIGYDYETYDDMIEHKKYIEWTERWMTVCFGVLASNGSMYVAIGDEYAAEVKMIAKKVGFTTRNWIIWHYSFGQNMNRKFSRSHTHIFYFIKNQKDFVFNDEAVRVKSARQIVYNDARADSRGKVPDDVWHYSRVCGTFHERVGWHPCQMPLRLMARIIKASSNTGDLVLDPFSGSASTCVAAAVLGRHYIGIDIDSKYVALGQKRVDEILSSCISDIDEKEEQSSFIHSGKKKSLIGGSIGQLPLFES